MRIRIRDTGAVMLEGEFRAYQKANGGPSWDSTTDEVLEALGADPVFEGPQVSQLEFWQHSMLQGVEQVEGKWYTKYVPGPVFETLQEQNEYVAQKTLERAQALKETMVQAIQDHLDAFARTRDYDDIKSACGYAGCSVPKYDIEGTYARDKRAETWFVGLQILADVQGGLRPMPTSFDQIKPELPQLVWPEV